jgi:lysyl-tRNA synthetase class 2
MAEPSDVPAGETAHEPDILEARRLKLERLRADGIDPFPPSYAGVVPIAEVRDAHPGLPAGEETDAQYRVAGRLAQRRGQGKMAFLDLVDRSGRIQLQARVDVLGPEKMERLVELDLGDLIGVDGTVFVTRRGELSLRVDDYTVLAKSLRPPPDKHHGLRDVETRFRHRELDLMANEEARAVFITRARIITELRRYLDEHGFIEVETPILQPLYGGAMARPFVTHHNALDRDLYLRIATELYLKRLLVGGLERVYEIGKNFRNEGISYKHNPEFTVVEWYEAYADYEDVMARFEALLPRLASAAEYAGEIDFTPPYPRVALVDVIRDATGIDVSVHADRASLVAAIREAGIDMPTDDLTWPALVDDLFSKKVEPTLIQPTFVVDFPKEISPLAKDHRSKPGFVERFEAFAGGMEIANAFTELNDPDEQRARFESQARLAKEGDEEAQPYDEAFVQALEHGMPPAGGIGIGIDRVVMLMTGHHSIREIVLFPAMRD